MVHRLAWKLYNYGRSCVVPTYFSVNQCIVGHLFHGCSNRQKKESSCSINWPTPPNHDARGVFHGLYCVSFIKLLSDGSTNVTLPGSTLLHSWFIQKQYFAPLLFCPCCIVLGESPPLILHSLLSEICMQACALLSQNHPPSVRWQSTTNFCTFNQQCRLNFVSKTHRRPNCYSTNDVVVARVVFLGLPGFLPVDSSEHRPAPFPRQIFVKLMEMAISSVEFSFDNIMQHQVEGVAVESPFRPPLPMFCWLLWI